MPKPIRYEDKLGGGWRCSFYNRDRTKQFRRKFPDWEHSGSAENSRLACVKFINTTDPIGVSPDTRILKEIKTYLDYCHKNNIKRKSTLINDEQRLSLFGKWADNANIRSLDSFSLEDMRKFSTYFYANYPFYRFNNVRKKTRPDATWDKYRMIISSVLKWNGEDYPISNRKEFKHKVQEIPIRWFTLKELTALFTYFESLNDPIIAVWFKTLAWTGMRKGELYNLKWKNVDLKKKEITVAEDTKNYRIRIIPINKDLLPCLKSIPNKSGLVFKTPEGLPYHRGSRWYMILQDALNHCKLEQTGMHSFRHSFGSALGRSGCHPKIIQELMGHSTLDMAMHYTHFHKDDLHAAMDKIVQ